MEHSGSGITIHSKKGYELVLVPGIEKHCFLEKFQFQQLLKLAPFLDQRFCIS